jgi:hypothetical protein
LEQEVPVRSRRLVLCLVFALALAADPAQAQPPSNDNFANATAIPSLPFSDTVDTTEATSEPFDAEVVATCGASVVATNTVWYSYTAPVDQFVAFDTSGSTYGVGVAVITGGPGSFSTVGCFAASGGFSAVAGQTYHLGFGDIGGGTGGTLTLSVTAPQPPMVDISVNRFGSFDAHTGVATVTGTVTCTESALAQIFASLAQEREGVITSGFTFVNPLCDGTEHTWSATIQPFDGRFKGGPARAVVDVSACSAGTCASDDVARTIVLRH